jgi:hypothetical protein
MKALPKKLLPLTLFGFAVASLFSVRPAEAYTVTLRDVGFDTVVATGSGVLDLTGLTHTGDGGRAAEIAPEAGNILTGSIVFGFSDMYQGPITGPSNFGRGGLTFANSGTGDTVGMQFNRGNPLFIFLVVPDGYVSGTPLSDSATYNNVTLRTLFVTPGTYVWTWGDGADQRFTLKIESLGVPPPVPDGGSTVSLLGCALFGVAALRRKLRC